ncbi:MAG: L-2-hydroxycarboxylate dehydrogenase, partial [Alphaproteobacteria bacterium]|nr:L-2-hydroxycarboxylate dehydrogenase [Alphaproteobacteria bacterium]
MSQARTSDRVPVTAITGLIEDALATSGLPAGDAAKVAVLMTEADLTGADAHGVFRLPQYVRRLKAGGVNPRPDIRVTKTAPATAMVDGDNGMGHLVMARAAETAIELARATGIGWVGARNSNHAGAAGIYPEMCVQQGMVGIYAAVSTLNHMAPWGGAEALMGTNPIAIGIPAGKEAPVLLDIATSVSSFGNIRQHLARNEPLQEGWVVHSKTGEPITDPKKVGEGVLLPIGGHKGSGLALMIGLLAGVLNG